MMTTPFFFFFNREAVLNDRTPVFFDRGTDFQLNETEFINAIALHQPELVILGNPDNPTGQPVSNCFLARLMKQFKDTLFLIDEVYNEYAEESSLSLVNKFDNLIIIRSFSKIGFAAFRLGILLSAEQNTVQLGKLKLPYNINAFTVNMSHIVLDNFELIRSQIATIINERERVKACLSSIRGIDVIDTRSNFNLISCNRPQKETFDNYLIKNKIFVKNVTEKNNKSWFRMSVGSKEDNDYLLLMSTNYLNSDQQVQR
jgi:histidinol-phosphate aminotransferase